jgi:hypothetical protein
MALFVGSQLVNASLEPQGGPSLQLEPSLQLAAPHLEDLTNGRRLAPGGAGAGTFMGWGLL